jgi:hypothetical protein
MIKEIALASIVLFGETYVDLVDVPNASYHCGVTHNRFDRIVSFSIEHGIPPDMIYDKSETVRTIVEIWTQCTWRGYGTD